MRELEFLEVMGYLADDLVTEAKEVPMKQHSLTRPVKLALIAAAILVLLTGTVLAIHYTRITESMEEDWNARGTQMTQAHKDFVESRSADIGESVTDNGITVTIDSVTCTTNTVYCIYTVEVGEAYDLEALNAVQLDDLVKAVSEEYGTLRRTTGGYHVLEQTGGLLTCQATYFFKDLPEGATLADGRTTLQLHYDGGTLGYAGDLDNPVPFEGTWDFAFPLPESASTTSTTADAVLDFGGGVTLTLSNIAISDSGCTFTVTTDLRRYQITSYQNQEHLEFMREREPDKVFITFEARFADGTAVLSASGGASLDQATGRYDHHIEWSVPIDPAQVTALIFSDGKTEIEVPIPQ